MKRSGIKSILQKLYFMCLPTQPMRSKYITKHSHEFRHVGGGIFWQSRYFPADPDLISIGNNVFITAGVSFVNHDTIRNMLNRKFGVSTFQRSLGCIEVGDNVMIGSGTRILQDVRIGSNVIIGAGSIVTKDIPDNCVAAGVPCRVLGSFDDFVKKRERIVAFETPSEYWDDFYKKRNLQ